MDENRTLRPAEGYEGNIEEGLARYEAAHGRTHPIGTTDSPGTIGNNDVPLPFDGQRLAPNGVTDKGDRAKNQNEIVEERRGIEAKAEETCGRGTGRVRDPRRTETFGLGARFPTPKALHIKAQGRVAHPGMARVEPR